MKSIICVCLFVVLTFVKADEPLPTIPDDGSCVLGKSYQDGCSVCSCFGEKALLCKKKEGCIDSKNAIEKETDIQDKCKEGEVKYGPLGECNVCICLRGQGGVIDWSCNDENCPVNRRKRGVGTIPDLKYTPCAPNDSFVLDCNTCYCNSAKSGYRCSEHICDPDNSSEILIAENGTKPDSFNVSSTLFNATITPIRTNVTTSNNVTFITARTESIETSVRLESADTSAATDNGTHLITSSTTPKSVVNSTTENSVLSLG